jgi:hypothetical protein
LGLSHKAFAAAAAAAAADDGVLATAGDISLFVFSFDFPLNTCKGAEAERFLL